MSNQSEPYTPNWKEIDREAIETYGEAWARAQNFAAGVFKRATPIEESLLDTQRHLGMLSDQIAELARRTEALIAERRRIALILSTFQQAPISISSLQLVLDLARELNPEVKS